MTDKPAQVLTSLIDTARRLFERYHWLSGPGMQANGLHARTPFRVQLRGAHAGDLAFKLRERIAEELAAVRSMYA